MPSTVACSACGTKLHLPDGLSGKQVRCARCGEVFSVPAASPDRPADRPASGAPPEPTDEPAFPQPPPPPPPVGEDQAFRLNLTLDDSPPAESHEQLETEPEPEEKPRRPRRRPRLNDDHDDLTECPRCGKHAHRDYSRCPYCGLRFSSEPAAERRPYFGRRDSEPHRGGLVLALGIIGICGAFCPLVGLVFGILAWILGQGDLSKMKRGQMDPSGEGITQGGWICGIIATVLSLFMSLGCGGFLIMAAADNAQQRNPPAFGPPPVRQVRPAR